MKRLFILTFLVLAGCLQAVGQENSVCPKLKVLSPDKVQEGELVTFAAILEDKQDIKDVSLKWRVFKDDLKNEIKDEYQPIGKSKDITIDTTGIKVLKVTVEISEGISIECKAKNIISTEVSISPSEIFPIDEAFLLDNSYEKSEKDIYDNLVFELNNKPDYATFIQFMVIKKENLKEIKERITKVLDYLEIGLSLFEKI